MKIKFDKLKTLTNFGESPIDYIPFISIFFKKNMGLQISLGFYKWSYILRIASNKNEYL